MDKETLTTNSIAFIGLCSEYCSALERARESTRCDFVKQMLRLLPRLYIAATDLLAANATTGDEDFYIDSALDEDYYDSIRRTVESLMGPDDTYLEVFESDMKYSDTPIAASVSENLSDLFQVTFNFVETVRDAPADAVRMALGAVAEDFKGYWSQILCNVLRPLNNIAHNIDSDSYDDEN